MYLQSNVLKQSGDSRIILCLDRVEQGDYCGRLYNHLDRREVAFRGFMDLVYQVESVLVRIKFPKPAHAYHSFLAENESEERPRTFQLPGDFEYEELHPGDMATYVVQVQFRQNATWYGLLYVKDNERPLRFRSVLELTRFLDRELAALTSHKT